MRSCGPYQQEAIDNLPSGILPPLPTNAGKSLVPTKKAAAFMMANTESGVVSGAVHEYKGVPGHGKGCTYVLADGRSFVLTTEDCQSMPMPRWDFEANGN